MLAFLFLRSFCVSKECILNPKERFQNKFSSQRRFLWVKLYGIKIILMHCRAKRSNILCACRGESVDGHIIAVYKIRVLTFNSGVEPAVGKSQIIPTHMGYFRIALWNEPLYVLVKNSQALGLIFF